MFNGRIRPRYRLAIPIGSVVELALCKHFVLSQVMRYWNPF